VYWRRELSAVPAVSRELTPPKTTQYTAIKFNLSVKITKKFSLKMTQQVRNM
jgi:hypothetical protein